MRSMVSKKHLRHRGLTLIELAFVVAILAILAGFLVPRLGIVRNLAARAGNADQTRAALDQVVLYNVEQGKYPQGLDTLLDAGALYSKLDSNLSAVLTPGTLTVNGAKSVNSFVTFDNTGATPSYFFDQDPLATVAGDSGKISSPVLVAGGSKVAQVKIPVAADVTGNKANYQIYAGVYGPDRLDATTGAPLDGSFLIALGFGPNSELNGKTALGAPALYTKDPNAYNRAVLLVKVFPTTVATYTGSVSGATYTGVTAGTSASTAGALSPDGQLVSQSLSKYQAEKNR